MSSKKPKTAPKPSVAPPAPTESTRGTGKFYYKSGATYEGEWIFDANAELLPPSSTSQDLNATPSSTDKANGVRFREGKGVYKDGEYSYEGDWTRDLANGEGTFRFASGGVYEGQWQMGVYFGKGTYKVQEKLEALVGDFATELMSDFDLGIERLIWRDSLAAWLLVTFILDRDKCNSFGLFLLSPRDRLPALGVDESILADWMTVLIQGLGPRYPLPWAADTD